MTSPIDFRYRAFLSYSHANTNHARFLHKRIEGFPLADLAGRQTARGLVPKRLAPIFRDRDDFTAGHSLSAQTLAALEASEALIVVCSPAAAKSHYVNEEIRLFKWKHPERLVIPVIADGKPGDLLRECFPPALRFKVDASGAVTEEREPDMLAADLREEGDGRELALAKVVASLIGVPSDEVFRRAERDRRARARIRNAVIALILTLSGGTGFFVWQWQKGRAELTEINALVEQYAPIGSAQAQQPGARERLRTALESIAKGTATEPRYRRAFNLLKARKPQEAELLLREVADEKVAAALQNYKQAAISFLHLGNITRYIQPERSREYFARALELDPDNVEGIILNVDGKERAGLINQVQAEAAYRRVLEVAVEGKNDREMHWALIKLGDIQSKKNKSAEAKMYYEKSWDIIKRNLADNSAWVLQVIQSYTRLAEVEKKEGNIERAIELYKAVTETYKLMAKEWPNVPYVQYALSHSHVDVGRAFQLQNNNAEALHYFNESLLIRKGLSEAYPEDISYKTALYFVYTRIGEVLNAQGNLANALSAYRQVQEIVRPLAKADPRNIKLQTDLAQSFIIVAVILKNQNQPQEALSALRDHLAIRKDIVKVYPENVELQVKVAAAYIALAHSDEKLKNLQQAADILRRLNNQGPLSPNVKVILDGVEAQIAALEK